MKRVLHIFKEMLFLIRKHKAYFIAPILIVLAILVFVAFYAGPTAFVTFMYAGF